MIINPAAPGAGEMLSIFDIQYSTDLNGISPRQGQVVSCLGGVVTYKRISGWPRIVLQDPLIRNPAVQDENCQWGAIQVKDWFSTTFDEVEVGDWIALQNVTVQDYSGTTFLQYWNANPDGTDPNFTIVSSNNPLPQPVAVELRMITVPLADPGDPGCWYVTDHQAEQYESMGLEIKNVVITGKGLGKAGDNYLLQSTTNPADPNQSCWAADYLNIDKTGPYHAYVEIDRYFCRLQGILEHYRNLGDGWDYYQLITTKTEDFLITQPGDFNDDCQVGIDDFTLISRYWLTQCPTDPNLCGNADITGDSMVNSADLAEFSEVWLAGTP